MKTKYESEKKLFDKYNIYTLDSIGILFEAAGIEAPLALTVIQKKKFKDNSEDLEGMNEYTYDTMLDNFNLDEVIEKLPELTNEELAYITKLITAALGTINPSQKELSIIPKLTDYLKHYNKEMGERITPIKNGFSLSDIRRFFMKFNDLEIDAFENILKYSNQDHMHEIKRVKNEVRQVKYRNARFTNKEPERNKSMTIEDLQRKIPLLTRPQLDIFHMFVGEAVLNLEIKVKWVDLPENQSDETDKENTLYEELSSLLNTIEKTQEEYRQVMEYKIKN